MSGPAAVPGEFTVLPDLMDAAVAQIRDMIGMLQQGRDLPVIFLGGLGGHYAKRLAGLWDIRAPLGNGLDGALFLARQEG